MVLYVSTCEQSVSDIEIDNINKDYKKWNVLHVYLYTASHFCGAKLWGTGSKWKIWNQNVTDDGLFQGLTQSCQTNNFNMKHYQIDYGLMCLWKFCKQ